MDHEFDLGFDTFIAPIASDPTFPNASTFSPTPLRAAQAGWPNHGELGSELFLSHSLPLTPYANGLQSIPAGQQTHYNGTESYNTSSTGDDAKEYMDADVDVNVDHPAEGNPAHKPPTSRRHTDGGLASPAQSRRKAQNRAAQRAFRERKERHVRELEAQLTALTEKATSLQCDNDRLVGLVRKVQHENKFLRSRQVQRFRSSTAESNTLPGSKSSETPLMQTSASSRGSPQTQSISEPTTPSSANGALSPTSSKCLDPAATWDLLVSHPLFLKGVVDITQVCDKLGTLARCEETSGPYFDETDVRRVIEEVASDENTMSG